MTKKFLPLVAASLLLSGAAIAQQNRANQTDRSTQSDHSTADSSRRGSTRGEYDKDATYGRVKEIAAGKKLVIDVDNAPDKSYDLTDTKTLVNVPAGLKVGDPVKVTETERNGRKMVQIAKDSNPNVTHGDPGNENSDHVGDNPARR